MLVPLRLRVLRCTDRDVVNHPLRQLVREVLFRLANDAINYLVNLNAPGEPRGGLVQDFLAQACQIDLLQDASQHCVGQRVRDRQCRLDQRHCAWS